MKAAIWAMIAAAIFVLASVALIALALPVLAHGGAAWIQNNPMTAYCCGVEDCDALAEGEVRITLGGYYMVSREETVPFHEAKASINGQYWLCRNLGTNARRCFFAPAVGS
jgi:hypothetical protein